MADFFKKTKYKTQLTVPNFAYSTDSKSTIFFENKPDRIQCKMEADSV